MSLAHIINRSDRVVFTSSVGAVAINTKRHYQALLEQVEQEQSEGEQQ